MAQQRTAFTSDWYRMDGGHIGLPGWRVSFRLGNHADASGVAVVAAMEIVPIDESRVPGNGITGRLLRQVRLQGHQTNRAVRQTTRVLDRQPQPGGPRRRGRPARYTTDWYRALSLRYNELGPGRRHLLAYEFGMKPTTMRSAIMRCRRMGMLAPTVTGRAT